MYENTFTLTAFIITLPKLAVLTRTVQVQ
jgi:hypothetical protein